MGEALVPTLMAITSRLRFGERVYLVTTIPFSQVVQTRA